MNFMSNPAFRKVRCMETRIAIPSQIVVGNDYYIKMTTIEWQDDEEYVDVYKDPIGIDFVGRLRLRHFTELPFCDRITWREELK